MDDPITWMRAQLDDDERVAREATWGPWEVGPTFGGRDNRVYVKPEGPGIDTIGTCVIAGQVANTPQYRANAQHIARHDPARVLAEVDAKRRILDAHPIEYSKVSEYTDCAACVDVDSYDAYPCLTVRLLALPYADRPGYRDEWRP
ncbi:DUF6221 family protein [Micromonospora taraxaci]|uniref:DUF6221 family protein n=1 Tax=Micromonospora taraxaci TaxID=1316803 RepID=UPI003C2EA4D6